MQRKAIVIDDSDNVVNLIGPGNKGDQVDCTVADADTEAFTLADDLPSNHKFARRDIKSGEDIIKYGLVIGVASTNIAKGRHVHAHNIDSNRGRGDKK